MLALALLAVQLNGSDELIELQFKWVPARGQSIVIVQSGQLATPKQSETREYWFRRTVDNGQAQAIWWTDTLRCPDARWVLKEATRLPPPRAVIYGIDDSALKDGIIVTADGSNYEITVNALYGDKAGSELHFDAVDGTPLADWVGESLRKLDMCWSTERPSDPLL